MPSLSLRLELLLSALRRKRGEVFHNKRGAINGYDPVAYFSEQKSIVGNKQISYSWKGAKWYFSSAANKENFASDPEKFMPQFGGFCAYGVHNGYKIHADPCCWTIFEERLYLNYNKRVQQMWRADPQKYIAVAAENWERLKDRY
ncbi:MAG: YHS domain-containing (seleno)protein [Imperialibacter sp.]|uniref:YHS domain-containing (seleno)protein n=1 Tax=Imperialibacter sp. TaxID=2038411 RepID=UPI003A83FF7D